MTERWRPVLGFEGSYEVSDQGRVRSLDRTIIVVQADKWGGPKRPVAVRRRGRILRPGSSQPSGHLTVSLGANNSQSVHILVLEAFVGPRPAGLEGLHWDDVSANNFLANLRWGTRSENLHDAVRNGRKAIGERHHNTKLRVTDIPRIRELLRTTPATQVASAYSVAKATILAIKWGKTWAHVPHSNEREAEA